ncbi:MAG: hypothetical protein JF588_05660 [Caulobacterales bacterium]|nr:hypothetical protein [Caulobacterales bacterium]
MERATPEELVDYIYEAGAIPGRWPELLGRLGRAFGTRGGLLFGGADPDFQWIGGGELQVIMADFIAAGWMAQNDRVARTLSARHMGFLADFHTPEEIARLPMYTEFLTPRGVDAPVGTWAPGIMDDDFVVSIEGFPSLEAARAAIPRLDGLRPHLARAAALSARLGLERARAAVTALETLGAPAAYLGPRGRIVAANALFERELGHRLFDTRAGLRTKPAAKAQDNDPLAAVLLRIGAGAPAGRSLPLRSAEDLPASVMHLIPLRRDARDIFTRSIALAVITSRKSRLSLGNGVLEALFDLTPTEAQLASKVAEGITVQEIASARGISIQTARVHMRNIYTKLGLSRQAELTNLLRDLALPQR